MTTDLPRYRVATCPDCGRMTSIPNWCERPVCVHSWDGNAVEVWDDVADPMSASVEPSWRAEGEHWRYMTVEAAPPPASGDLDAARAALVDLTSAYHHERRHSGKWDVCQRPRCQNARLALTGRGPFAARLFPPRAVSLGSVRYDDDVYSGNVCHVGWGWHKHDPLRAWVVLTPPSEESRPEEAEA